MKDLIDCHLHKIYDILPIGKLANGIMPSNKIMPEKHEVEMPSQKPKSYERRYLMTSSELLSPEIGAIEIGKLEAGQYQAVREKMMKEAKTRGISNPLIVADIIFQENKRSEYGSAGQPYPVNEAEWESFVKDVPSYCGDKIPKIYMLDGDKFIAPI